jgi:hypothetical protein
MIVRTFKKNVSFLWSFDEANLGILWEVKMKRMNISINYPRCRKKHNTITVKPELMTTSE